MTSEPDDQDMIYANIVLKVFNVCKADSTTDKLVVFVANRKDNGKKVYLLGHAKDLGPVGEQTPNSKYWIIAEFVPSDSTEELYEIKDYFAPNFKPADPLPANVIPFRKKK